MEGPGLPRRCVAASPPVPRGGLDREEIGPGAFGVEGVTLGGPVRQAPEAGAAARHVARAGLNRPRGALLLAPWVPGPQVTGPGGCRVRAAPCRGRARSPHPQAAALGSPLAPSHRPEIVSGVYLQLSVPFGVHPLIMAPL